MKYLVNNKTKEHVKKGLAPLWLDEDPDWRTVEADSEGWIPWDGGECPLPDGARCEVKTSGGWLHFLERSENYQTDWAGYIIAYRPNFSEPETVLRTKTNNGKPITIEQPLNTQVAGDHYKNLKIQPVEYIHGNGIGFIEGSVIKYVTRWRDKGGIDDLRKARHFIDLLIDLELKNDEA